MRSTLNCIASVPGLALEVLVTGMHLSAAHGMTVEEIRASGLVVAGELQLDMDTRNATSMVLGIADCLHGITGVLARERPDMLLLLGDRGEMLAGAIAALHLGIVTAHIHGGERSGTVDEPVRHAISKLCTYHFVATRPSADRLIRMGEDPARIFVTGAPGLDGLEAAAAMDPQSCRQALGLEGDRDFVLALFHPVVQQARDAFIQTQALAQALSSLGRPVVWLAPNSDAGSADILRALETSGLPAGSVRLTHLPREVFCAAMRHCSVMVGNSSAGIIEAASFGTPVVNVGDRQKLRERNDNVVDVPVQAEAIGKALEAALAHGRWPCINRYGDGATAGRIAGLVETLALSADLLEKTNTY
ncbi:MAG: UDP-N-acetylglucosamine 2-epimerase (hydrolyzing) [Ramlibacter sp.]|nr:UDP-N-acetylglucosamine 2-epimerase (hydrolyzing) [Ramlibacter sp.]